MTTALPAAALLVAALLIAPGPPRHRLGLSPRSPRWPGPRPPGLAFAAPVLLVAALVSPALPPAIALLGAAAWARRRAARRRRDAEAEARALADALEMMVAELRVGAHPVHALALAAEETGGPAGAALSAVTAAARLGGAVPAALAAAADRSALPGHWHRLAVAWRLAGEHGLAIAEVLAAAHRDVQERRRYADEVAAGLAGARATTAILAGLPGLGLLLGHALGADPVAFLTGPGGGCLLLGTGFLTAGLLWAGRITDRLTRP